MPEFRRIEGGVARYDLHGCLTSFDFFSWLVMVKALGAAEIVIDTTKMRDYKWPRSVCEQRVASIIEPGCALAGLPFRHGTDGECPFGSDLRNLTDFLAGGGRISPLRSPLPRRAQRYTVTIRETQRSLSRNSNIEAWFQFASSIGATVIEDYDVKPIDLHERIALYAGAEMNFFVVSGPAHVCSLGGWPCMVFDAHINASTLRRNGIAFGEKFPWYVEDQHLFWEPGELPMISVRFKEWRDAKHRVEAA